MVAFKEEFPYLRCLPGSSSSSTSNGCARRSPALPTKPATRAGGSRITFTESITFYLRLRNDEPVVPFDQLSQTVRYVLKVIGYKEIIPFFSPAPPPISFSLVEIAEEAGAGYELAFFDRLEKRITAIVNTGTDSVQLVGLQQCVKHLRGAKTWTRACDSLREEVVCFVREKLAAGGEREHIRCSVR
jgi:hypothetical protein